jgi:hypothetical protein
MAFQTKLLSAAVFSLLALAGCGGGGGSADTASGATVPLSGTAAKGILIGAEVSVYSLAGGKKGDKALATATTDADGKYTLKIAPTTDPVMIEVKAVSGTTMLDETGTLVAGKFPAVTAPAGLTMRSFAANASQETVVRVNPLTEMAVAVAAGATGGLSLTNLSAGQQVAQSAAPTGVNPFTQEPVAEPAKMDDGQLKFAIKMAGLMSSAKANTLCDVQCQIKSLSEGVSFTVADGKPTFSAEVTKKIAEKSSTLLASGTASLKVNANQASSLASTGTQLRASADSKAANPVAFVGAKTEDVVAANGLQGFIDAMRNGFRATETRLLKAEQDWNKRYESVTFDGLESVNSLLSAIETDCDADLLTCKSSSSSILQWSGSNGSFSWTRKRPDDLGRTTTGTVVGVKGTDGKRSVTVNGTVSLKDKQTAELKNLSFNLAGENDNLTGSISGTVQVNNQSSDLTVSLNLDNIQVTSTVVKPNVQSNVSFKGGISLAASNGDRLSGTLDMKMVEVRRVVSFGAATSVQSYSYTVLDDFLTDGVIQLKAETTATGPKMEILALDATVKASQSDYTKPVTASNPETFNGSFKIALADNLTSLTFNESAADWKEVKQSVAIVSGLSGVKLDVTYTLDKQSGAWCQWNHDVKRCANELKLESTNANPYNATLTKNNNGKITGDIFLGPTKVGEIVNGVLKINGAEVSLY